MAMVIASQQMSPSPTSRRGIVEFYRDQFARLLVERQREFKKLSQLLQTELRTVPKGTFLGGLITREGNCGLRPTSVPEEQGSDRAQVKRRAWCYTLVVDGKQNG